MGAGSARPKEHPRMVLVSMMDLDVELARVSQFVRQGTGGMGRWRAPDWNQKPRHAAARWLSYCVVLMWSHGYAAVVSAHMGSRPGGVRGKLRSIARSYRSRWMPHGNMQPRNSRPAGVWLFRPFVY